MSLDKMAFQQHSHCPLVSISVCFFLSSHQIIVLNFVEFKVEAHPQCSYDSLTIRDGATTSAHVMHTLCGDASSLPNGGVINSTDNALHLTFRSDASNSADGFRIHWTSTAPGQCVCADVC